WPTVRQCASLSSRGDAMQKLKAAGPSVVRVQQLPAVGGAVVQVPVAESQTLPGGPGVPLNRGPVQSSGSNHRQAEATRSQQPAASGVVVVVADVLDVVVVEDGAIVVVGEPGIVALLVGRAGDGGGQAVPS